MARQRRKYGLFERQKGERRWQRCLPNVEGKKESVLRLAQTWLIEGALRSDIEREVRPVKEEKKVTP